MKKETKSETQKSAKMSKLASLVYSSAGIGLVTVVTTILAFDPPKNPRYLGE